MILVLSHRDDTHAAEVLHHLEERGAPALLLDTAAFPSRAALTVDQRGTDWQATIDHDGGRHRLDHARVVWWRRPQPFTLDAGIRGEDRSFAWSECTAALAGLWSSLDATWINDPDRDDIAGRKMFQLRTAAELGLRVPRTCITNDVASARRFVAGEGAAGTIYKSFSATERAWRETRLLRDEEVGLLDHVRIAPLIFQEHIAAHADLRITVVGRQVFPAAIRGRPGAYECDFRMAIDDADIEPYELPAKVEQRLLDLMDRFGLHYGAIDMRITPEGEHVFLEINPAGQWLFVELCTGQPITDAMCELMVSLDE